MPELSIIVPVYKVEKYLPKCIDSILAQTFRDFELLLIDDGSPDRCGEICDAYAARDRRIRVIHQKNQGVSAARNAGLDAACGTYLSFLDSDDSFSPQLFERMISVQKSTHADVVVCGFSSFAEDGSMVFQSSLPERAYSAEQLWDAIYTVPDPLEGVCWNKLFLRSKIGRSRFPVGVARAEDTLFLLTAFSSCTSGYSIPDPLCYIAARDGSASRSHTVSAMREAIAGVRLLYTARRQVPASASREALAANYFLDQTLRFSTLLKKYAEEERLSVVSDLLSIKCSMFRLILRAYFKRLLPKAKIHGYLYEMIRL